MKLYNAEKGEKFGQADPFALCAEGRYFIYATGADGAQVYESDRLGNFSRLGLCYQRSGYVNFWAPAVLYYKGRYYMYCSMQPSDKDEHSQTLTVAVSDSPRGPFTYVCDLVPPFSIDAHPVIYKDELYLFYSVNDRTAERVGTLIVLDKMESPTKMCGAPKVVVRPTLDEEIFRRDRFKVGEHWHTIEGACYLYADGVHYLMYSGSAYTNPTYFVGYATAKGEPDDLRDLNFTKFPDELTYHPLLSQNDFVEGLGHNSTLEYDGKVWIVYHGRDRVPGAVRTMRADILRIGDGTLEVTVTK